MRRLTVLGLGALLATLGTMASADSVMGEITDGQPWDLTNPGGRTLNVTFFPDGTGQMRVMGMRRDIQWQANGDQMCLTGMPRGRSPCFTWERAGDGFSALSPEGDRVTLTR